MIHCDRTDKAKKPYVRGHMMGPGKGVLKVYDDSFWERWYLPPGVHPLDVADKVKEESEFYSER
jgi:hypothetical protein